MEIKDKIIFLESEIKRADDFLNKNKENSNNSFVIQFKKEKIEEIKHAIENIGYDLEDSLFLEVTQ